MSHGSVMLHLYAWRRGGEGPYFVNGPATIDEGIAFAETLRLDCRRGFARFEIHDVRAQTVVWRSHAHDDARTKIERRPG